MYTLHLKGFPATGVYITFLADFEESKPFLAHLLVSIWLISLCIYVTNLYCAFSRKT